MRTPVNIMINGIYFQVKVWIVKLITPVKSAVGSAPTLLAVARAVEAAAMEQAP